LVDARYVLRSDGQVGIRLAPYDTSKAVIIDPVLTYATRLGGSSGVLNAVIAADAAGNVYVSGTTGAFDFPVVRGFPVPVKELAAQLRDRLPFTANQ
jgi:hypothetical protein